VTMVDYEKQQKFAELADKLKELLQQRYEHEFTWWQGPNANRFDLHSKRPATPYYEVTFSSEERLGVSVSDGAYEPPFTAVVNLSHCVTVNRESCTWEFDTMAIWQAVKRLCDLGRDIYLEHEKGQKR